MRTAYLLDPLAPPDAPRWRTVEDRDAPYLVPKPPPRVKYESAPRWEPLSIEYISCNGREYASPILDWRGQVFAADHDHALTCMLAGEAAILFFVELAQRGAAEAMREEAERRLRVAGRRWTIVIGPEGEAQRVWE